MSRDNTSQADAAVHGGVLLPNMSQIEYSWMKLPGEANSSNADNNGLRIG